MGVRGTGHARVVADKGLVRVRRARRAGISLPRVPSNAHALGALDSALEARHVCRTGAARCEARVRLEEARRTRRTCPSLLCPPSRTRARAVFSRQRGGAQVDAAAKRSEVKPLREHRLLAGHREGQHTEYTQHTQHETHAARHSLSCAQQSHAGAAVYIVLASARKMFSFFY